MEAPENMYISNVPSELGGYKYITCDKNFPHAVEYTRTDALIEKALTYLHDKLHFDNVFYGVVSTDFNSMEEMYEDFKNYMKGE